MGRYGTLIRSYERLCILEKFELTPNLDLWTIKIDNNCKFVALANLQFLQIYSHAFTLPNATH